MISARDFVLSYSEWFSYIAEHHGHEAVEQLWASISDEFLTHFQNLIAENGFDGMVEHWGRTLTEEDAGCEIKLEHETFRILMHRCPSVGALQEAKHMKMYPRYCEHCVALYARAMADHGFDFVATDIDCEKGRCELVARRSKDSWRKTP